MPNARQGISDISHICLGHGIRHAVISPGSRSAPLTLAFVANPQFRCHSMPDERSAAYFAMGMAQQLKKPVVLVCTSGTAVANYMPALAEARYLKVPLLVLTADRPPEWIDQNDGQTLRQENIFVNVVKRSFQMPVETEKENDLWYFTRSLNEAIAHCSLGNPGPVHINVPLREPLYSPLPQPSLPARIIHVVQGQPNLSHHTWETLQTTWQTLSRKWVVCGFSSKKEEPLNQLLSQMARQYQLIVMAENLSNLQDAHFIHAPERFMASLDPLQMEEFRPELLITIGGAVLSKRLKKYLRQYPPAQHWHIDEHDLFIDTYQSLSHNIRVSPHAFFQHMAPLADSHPSWCQMLLNQDRLAAERHAEYLNQAEFSDLTAYQEIFRQMPQGVILHLANSTPVRYAQLFETSKHTAYFSNRGTSGIDGCVSTAAGAAAVTAELNLLLLGDLAFIYDSNGFWNPHLPNNLRVIVMDNGGGNIFKLIETGPEADKIRPFIETPHQLSIQHLCAAFGLEYYPATSQEELRRILPDFFKPNSRPVVLHIRTSGDVSAQVFKQYYQFISYNNEYEKKLDNTEGIQ